MNEPEFNNQSLNEYLLGTLPDAEAERFDELSFTDENFADALNAAEKDLVDAYLYDELNGATLKNFQTHYLASPVRREKVEFAKAFQVFAEKNIAEKSVVKPLFAESAPKRTVAGFFANIFAIPRPALQWSFALATLALVFFGGWLWNENSRLRSEMSQADVNREQITRREAEIAAREKQIQDETSNRQNADSENEKELARLREERTQLEEQLKKQTQEEKQRLAELQKNAAPRTAPTAAPPEYAPRLSIASFILAPSLRGGSRIQTVLIPARTTAVAANLELETDAYPAYRAVLRSQSDNRILWQSGTLKSKTVGENRRLRVAFPANLLKPESYTIEVSGVPANGAAEIISDYSFRLVR